MQPMRDRTRQSTAIIDELAVNGFTRLTTTARTRF